MTSALLTIPAGVLADRLGRKKILVLACIFEVLYFTLLITPTDNKVIIGEIMNGLGLCFYSGSYEGWLLNLNSKNQSREFINNTLKSGEFVFLAMMISSILGAIMGTYVFLIAAIALIITSLIFLSIPYTELTIAKHLSTKNIIHNALKYFAYDKVGVFLLVTSALYIGLIQLIFQFWQPFFKNLGISDNFKYGAIFSCALFFQYLISRIIRKLSSFNFAVVIQLISCWTISLICAILLNLCSNTHQTNIIIVLYCFFNGFIAGGSNLINVLIAQNINNDFHSTGISIIDCFGRLIGAISLFIVMQTINIATIKYIWLGVGIVFFLMAVIAYLLNRRSLLKGIHYCMNGK